MGESEDKSSIFKRENSTKENDMKNAETAYNDGKSSWSTLENIIPKDMSSDEYTVYIVIVVICLVVCCVLCFVLKKILLFAIIICAFIALVWWYMYIYRNQTKDGEKVE